VDNNNPMSCVLVIDDMLLFKVPLPLLIYPKGRGYKEGIESIIIMIIIMILSLTCLIYKSHVRVPTDRLCCLGPHATTV
jgi:hypothetical protein